MKCIPWLLLCATLSAQTVSRTHASFLDGTGLEIVTKTTGSSPIDANGSVGLGEGIPEHSAFRIVTDSNGNMLFGYSVTASRGAAPGAVTIRIFPLDVSKIAAGFSNLHTHGPVPTVSGVRDFPSVKIGEAVELDILSNPSTGEKIYDVLRPYISTPPENMQVSAVKVPDTISLRQIAIRVNGRAIPTAPSWIVGAAIRIEVPEHGAWVLSTYEPPAASGRNFERIAQVNGKTLSWSIGVNRIEITSDTAILSQPSEYIWVCEDRVSRAPRKADSPRFQAADTVESLLAARSDKK
jgi:hypothetical protein